MTLMSTVKVKEVIFISEVFRLIRKGVRFLEERTISRYDTKKVKLGALITEHHRARLRQLADGWGLSVNALLMVIIDELHYEPFAPPTLIPTTRYAAERVKNHFRERRPVWQKGNEQGERKIFLSSRS